MANTLNLGNGDWATKENSLLGYNSENGNYKPLPFDFTRASNGTFVNKSGLIETAANGVPRIDFLGNTSGALLLEPQRTNLITYSSDYTDASWNKVNSAGSTLPNVTSNYGISPDGTQNADRVQVSRASGAGDFSSVYKSITTSNVNRAHSIWLKSLSGTPTILILNNNGVYVSQQITTEWVRYELDLGVGTVTEIQLSVVGSNFVANVSESADFLAWGAQLELGSYSTSLINTQGSAVTRVSDACSQTNIPTSVINSLYPFSMYVESANIGENRFALCFINISSTSQYFVINMNNSEVQLDARSNGTSELIQSGITINTGAKFKVAITMESATSGKICVNGNTVVSKTNFASQIANSNIKDLLLGQLRVSGDTGDRLPIYDAKLYNTALTDAELQALTT